MVPTLGLFDFFEKLPAPHYCSRPNPQRCFFHRLVLRLACVAGEGLRFIDAVFAFVKFLAFGDSLIMSTSFNLYPAFLIELVANAPHEALAQLVLIISRVRHDLNNLLLVEHLDCWIEARNGPPSSPAG